MEVKNVKEFVMPEIIEAEITADASCSCNCKGPGAGAGC